MAIDYFTKWVEAASYKNVTQAVLARFLKHKIISHYGVTGELITDNGKDDPTTLPTVQDRAQKFSSLSHSDEWCSSSH